LASQSSHQTALPDDNIVIGVPYPGATYLQDSIVHAVARELGSDVIKLDQHDLYLLSNDLIDSKANSKFIGAITIVLLMTNVDWLLFPS
jgi:hypothetical protein